MECASLAQVLRDERIVANKKNDCSHLNKQAAAAAASPLRRLTGSGGGGGPKQKVKLDTEHMLATALAAPEAVAARLCGAADVDVESQATALRSAAASLAAAAAAAALESAL